MIIFSYLWEKRKIVGLLLVACFWLFVWLKVSYLKETDFSWYDRTLNYEAFSTTDERVLFLRDLLASEGYGADKKALPEKWQTSSDNVIKMYAMYSRADLDDPKVAEEFIKLVRRIILKEDEYFSFVLWNLGRAINEDSRGEIFIRKKYDYSKLAGLRGFYNAALASGGCKTARKWIGNGYYNNAKTGYLDDVAAWVVVSRKCQSEALMGLQFNEWQDNIQMMGCVLRHYQIAEESLFVPIAEKYAYSGPCEGRIDQWIEMQKADPSSFFSQLQALNLFSTDDIRREDFFEKDMQCIYVPYVLYSEDIRKTKYYRDCMGRKLLNST